MKTRRPNRYRNDRYFGYQAHYDPGDGFPLVTTKKLHLRSIIHELLWFIKGDSNIGYLKENKVRIWDEWAMKMVILEESMESSGEIDETRWFDC